MITPKGYTPHSFTIGLRHVPSFTFNDIRGTLADYILAECGADDSPLPKDFYTKIGMNKDTLELIDDERTNKVVITQEQVVFGTSKAEPSESPIDHKQLLAISQHLAKGIYDLLRRPALHFVGCVWEFVKTPETKADRYSHEIAKLLHDKYLKVILKNKEYPIDASFQLNFRKRVSQGLTSANCNDFLNIILTVRDRESSELYQQDEESDSKDEEKSEIAHIALDIQQRFDPKRKYIPGIIVNHEKTCREYIQERFDSLLGD